MNSLRWNLENSYRTLPEKFFDNGERSAFPNPTLRLFNHPLAKELGLMAEHEAINLNDSHIAAIFSGNIFPPNAKPIAQAYAGHQFGHFNMLGDGRATLLGEQITPKGKRIDIQLKGNGRTRYSRRVRTFIEKEP